jgi:hypothetical protein
MGQVGARGVELCFLCHDLPIAIAKSVTYVRGTRKSSKSQFLLLDMSSVTVAILGVSSNYSVP